MIFHDDRRTVGEAYRRPVWIVNRFAASRTVSSVRNGRRGLPPNMRYAEVFRVIPTRDRLAADTTWRRACEAIDAGTLLQEGTDGESLDSADLSK